MNPRTNYEMTEADLAEILNACKPTRVMMVGGYSPSGPQENANRAWAALGKKMGFDSMTVLPDSAKGMRFFTAVPNETDAQRNERMARENSERRRNEAAQLKAEITERQTKLDALAAIIQREEAEGGA